jgi:hypothetical protein
MPAGGLRHRVPSFLPGLPGNQHRSEHRQRRAGSQDAGGAAKRKEAGVAADLRCTAHLMHAMQFNPLSAIYCAVAERGLKSGGFLRSGC